MRDRTEADDIVQGAYNRALLDLILPPMRRAAKDAGYAITVHGSLNRDIDLVAIPWAERGVWTADALIQSIVGAMRGVVGRAHCHDKGWTEKPHGRRAKTLLAWVGENSANIDLSVMPTIERDDD
nr:hypothetical protein [uncultured bacterium]